MTTRKSPVFFDTEWDIADAGALQALARGEATPEQQKRALDWIINNGARCYDVSFIPDNQYATAFMEGRRFVGSKIVTMLKLNLQKLTRKEAQ